MLLRRRRRKLRLILAAGVGSLASLIILLPPMNAFLSFAVKLLISAVICVTAFKWGGKREFFKNTAAFYMISFLFCGVMIALWFTFTPKGMVINNSTVYFNISPVYLIISSLVTYLIVQLICRITGRRKAEKLFLDVKIEHLGKARELRGKLDTGCSLVEPFSGNPVIICSKKALNGLEPESIELKAETMAGARSDERLSSMSVHSGIRIIPYKTFSGQGLLPCFKPNRIFIDGRLCLNEIYIAVSERGIADNELDCLINPLCID